MKCKVCGNLTNKIFNAQVLNKYEVNYYWCKVCKFIQTEEAFWLDEAYLKAVSITDTGQISRNLSNANILKTIIPILIKNPQKLKFLDYGAGYGILVRLMRDTGYDFFWYDKFCKNLFAVGFEANKIDNFKIITAFELFEHFSDPIGEIKSILEFNTPDFLIFSTNIYKEEIPEKSWWYYSFESGQHISIYHLYTLRYIANKFDYYLLTDNNNLHIFTKYKFSNKYFNFTLKYLKYFSLFKKNKIKSRTFEDHLYLKNIINNKNI